MTWGGGVLALVVTLSFPRAAAGQSCSHDPTDGLFSLCWPLDGICRRSEQVSLPSPSTRLTSWTWVADGELVVETTDDEGAVAARFRCHYSESGSLLSVETEQGGSSRWAYEYEDGRLVGWSWDMDGDGRQVESCRYSYDLDGLPSGWVHEEVNGLRRETWLSRDEGGRLVAAESLDSGHRRRSEFAYDAAGRLTWVGSESYDERFYYDVDGRVLGEEIESRGHVTWRRIFLYQDDGLSQIEIEWSSADGGHVFSVQTKQFDSVGRLLTVSVDHNSGDSPATDGEPDAIIVNGYDCAPSPED